MCNDIWVINWDIGVNISYFNKKFTKYSKIIPKMVVKAKLGDCDISGYSVVARFISSNAEKDVIIAPSVIADGLAEFALGGNIFEDYGIWNVELTLTGVDGENQGGIQGIKYEIIQTKEGDNANVVVMSGTESSINDLVAELVEATLNANNGVTNATEINNALGITVQSATDKNTELLATISAANDKKNELTTELNKVPGEILKVTAELDKVPTATQSIKDELAKVDPKILELNNKIGEVDPEILKISNELAKVGPAITSINDKIAEVPAEVKKITDEGTTQKNELLELKNAIATTLDNDLTTARTVLNNQNNRLTGLMEDIYNEMIVSLNKL